MQWIIYPDGEKIIYGYDEGGQVTSVTGSHYNQSFPYVTKILYDQYGQRTRIEYGNGTYTDYTYNPERRWLETVKTKNKYGQSYQNIRYDFDRVGNVRSYVNDCMDTLSGNYKTDQSYEYDDLYQLIHVTGNTEYYPAISSVPDYKSTYTQDFAFDDKGLGNMMSKVSKETVSPLKVIGDKLNYNIGYVYDENYAHRLVQAGNRYYKYDANGNIICEQDGSFDGSENDVSYYKVEQHSEDVYSTDNGWGLFKDESGEGRGQTHRYRRTYTWNSRNQLVSSVDSNYSTSYVYGQRSNKYTQGSETLYFNKMWTLHTDNGNSVYGGQYAKNVYLGETRIVTKLARADQKTAHEEMYKQYYYHSDHLGSATMITDWEGKEYQRIEYTPYGETWVEKTNNSGSEFLPYKFTGKEVDQETGLYYYGARYLDPKYSMWLSTDPALGEYIPEMGKGNSKNSANLPGMGGVYNHINFHLYHYAGNNPVKYTDPDGESPWIAIPIIIGICMSLHSDVQPKSSPVDVTFINEKLSKLFYYDPAKKTDTGISSPYVREKIYSLKLEQHPLLALGAALPKGNYSESDYSNPNQLKGQAIVNTGTVLDGLSLVGTVVQNLSDGHLGDVTLNLKKTGRYVTSWNIILTTINPQTGKTTGRQVLSKEDALKYLNDNKEALKNDSVYKKLQNLLD